MVAAVRASEFPGLEVIVVDYSSTEGTRDILRQKVELLAARVLYHERNCVGGTSVAARALVVRCAPITVSPAPRG